MKNNRIKIALFKPFNAKTTNAFCSGQHPVFKYLQENYNYDITYLLDDKNVKFDTITNIYIERDEIRTFIFRVLRKILSKYKFYWKIPYYKNLDFSNYDIIITEGIHYLLLDYFQNIGHKIILNDSISYNYKLPKIQQKYLNKYFTDSLAVVVNVKIPFLYQKNGLKVKTITIGHAIETKLVPFILRKRSEGKLVSIGQLVPKKGFEYTIKVVSQLKNKYPALILDIYGDGFFKNNLERLIQGMGLKKTVFLKGFLEHKKLLKQLNNYDLFVSHPTSTKNWEEFFGMANIEAMANGIPVVSSNCGAIPYVIKDKGVVVEQENINQIAEAIESFIENPQKVKKYSVEGRKYIEKNYSIETIAKKWHKAIRQFIYERK